MDPYQGYRVKYGKSASDNWRLYDEASEDDYWFHVDNESSAHVILEIPNMNEPTQEVFEMCARLCVERTLKLKDEKSVKVIYTRISNLRKGKCVGEIMIQESSLVKTINVKRDIKK